jgi:hypothetical protein
MANKKPSPFTNIVSGLFNIAGSAYQAHQAGKNLNDAKDDMKIAKTALNDQMGVYSNIDTSNPFENLTNQYQDMENTMEDLTINQQQADFQSQQFQQSQANIMSGLRGAAGASGIAALAQSMAQQGQLAAQQASASIGAQESANQMASARMAGDLQSKERQGAQEVQQNIASGEQAAQQAEIAKQGALLDITSKDYQHHQEMVGQFQGQKDEAVGGLISGAGDLLGSFMSDKRLKKNIKLVGKSSSGLKIYVFEYIDKFFGDGVYQGVMSDEIPVDAVINNSSYDSVDYSKIDVEFKKLEYDNK